MEYKFLGKDTSYEVLSKLSFEDRQVLCAELRDKILNTVSHNGGHLASNLGTIELTCALLSVFDYKKDKFVFDVGHQCYAYKLLTGRFDKFDTLRQKDGISGFPRIYESEFDSFNTGHSSTSISAALGIKRALKHQGNNESEVVAIIGDGSMTGGMAYEAINDLGHSKDKVIVILNDNEMSIDKNTGGLSNYLSNLRLSPSYISAKQNTEKVLTKNLPVIGKPIVNMILAIKDFFRFLIYRKKPSIFEDLGLVYYGPIDGHDINALISAFTSVRKINAPVLLHVCTKKGKGYSYSEKKPSEYHGVSPFDLSTGVTASSSDSFTSHFGDLITKIADENPKVVGITAAMSSGTGLSIFENKHPDRFYDCGIAEAHAVTMASGMASCGLIPVVAIYSSFLQRSFDQIVTDTCFMNNHVVFAIDRAGVVGNDGHTHNGLLDMAYLSVMPNLTMFAPATYADLSKALNYSINDLSSPSAIRYPRGKSTNEDIVPPDSDILSPRIIADSGNQFIIVSIGVMADICQTAYNNLVSQGFNGKHINICRIKPLPTKQLLPYIKDSKIVFTVEDGITTGGIGQLIKAEIMDELSNENLSSKLTNFGFDDVIVHSASREEQLQDARLDANSLTEAFIRKIK